MSDTPHILARLETLGYRYMSFVKALRCLKIRIIETLYPYPSSIHKSCNAILAA
jgi:hypothetical protein